jgi:hypothetical protein
MTRFYKICLLAFLFFPFHSMASHGTGGEISWECQGNGQYIFRLNFYRDCAGIAAPNSVSLTTTVPGVTFISLQKISQFSIAPDGFQSDGVQSCVQCFNATGNSGIFEKVIYESALVVLPGLPAEIVGWQFYWGECCRSNFTNNISNPGTVGFRYRAVMYRTAGHQPGQCFDSSPVFAEIPQYNFCTGYSQSFSCMAIDPEGDSLTYAWAQPYDDNGASAPWSPGYSLNSQLPSATQNPLNEPAVLNSFSGQVDLKSFTGGLFAVCTKATSYRDGYKSAEIFRELSIVLNNSCAPILGGAQNLPPVINAPFIDPVTGLNTSWDTTVFAGDTVDFTISHQDFQFFNNTQGQVMTVTARGDQFGSNFTDPLSGCLDSPCATVFPSLPTTVPIAGQFTFNWVTSAAHAATLDNTHYFTFSICDNYCPANACVTKTAAIRVISRMPLAPPVIRCASVNQNGDVTLSWSPTTSVDTFGYFLHYKIYASLNSNGPYTLIDSVAGGINSSSWTVTSGQLQNGLGSSALQQTVFFRMSSVSSPLGGGESFYSGFIGTIHPNVYNTAQSQAFLTWNSPGNPASGSPYYHIYREYPIGTWTFLDSTAFMNYVDLSASTICNDSVSYRIERADSTGCFNVSSITGITLNTPASIAGVGGSQVLLCNGGAAWLSSMTSPATYLWSTGATTQSIQVNTLGNYTVTVTNFSGCSGTGTIQVTSAGSPPAPTIASPSFVFCQGSSTTLNAGSGYASYLWSTGAASQTIVVTVAGTYTVTVTNANGCTGTATAVVTVNPNPIPCINGITSICQGQTTILTACAGYTSYQWSTGQNFPQITVTTSGNYTITVTDANGCTGSASVTVTVNPLPGIGITSVGSTSFCQGDSVRLEAMGVGAAYLWHRNNSMVTPINATMVHYAKTKGSYYCVISDFNGCTNSSNIIYVDVPCVPIDPSQQRDPVTGESDQASIEVYPNPSFDEFTVKVSSSLYQQPDFIISDLSGRAIEFSWNKVDESSWVIDIPHPGFYFVKHQNQIIRLLKLE